MAYTHFRYVGYQVPTVGLGPGAENYLKIPPGNMPDLTGISQEAAGIINNVTNADARCRLARMYLVLMQAYQAIQTSDNNGTLKVFLAPEFYFRPYVEPGAQGLPAYSYEDYQSLKTGLISLKNLPLFNDWLIIPGTIVWQNTGPAGKRPFTGSVFYNTVVCSLSDNEHIVNEKTEASEVDGIPAASNAPFTVNPAYYSTWRKQRKHIFNFMGINCGIEICLEHSLGILKNQYGFFRRWFYSTPPISLHLLIAGGMNIINPLIATIPEGYILRTDGMKRGTQVELRNKNVPAANIIASTIAGIPASLQLPDPGCRPGYFFAQELHIYNPLPLAQ
ncbi:hypothetical protein ECE50_010625 [Chitinophaga sp. Mgbs1]|uniref:Uncharacterized protein n=1 Tax=Chitinophaga solisilvae TaxID=1233460 RepID=A0A433WNA0_9BACT|nr:hypothetical protein [Chitinophaga solisilvae]